MSRLNVYIKKEHEGLVNQGKDKGIKPSKALIEGYKSLLGKTATYALLEERRDILLKELSDVECQMDKLREEIIIDPGTQTKVLKDIARGYLSDNIIINDVLEVRRVELNLSSDEMKKLVKVKIIDPVERGDLTNFNLDSFFSEPENDNEDIDKAKSYFRSQIKREGKLNQGDVERWASGLDVESDELLSILTEEGILR